MAAVETIYPVAPKKLLRKKSMPAAIVVDSGPLVALFDHDDHYHAKAVAFIRTQRWHLQSALPVVAEVMYLLDFSLRAQLDFLQWIASGAVELIEANNSDLERVIQLMNKYSDLPMDFTNGLLVAICERLGVKRIATVDNDFTVYRYKDRSRFTNPFLD